MVSRKAKSAVFDAVSRFSHCDPVETIILAGFNRSGTTWLLELLGQLEGYKKMAEPLHFRIAQDHGFTARTFLRPGEGSELQIRYGQRLLEGKIGLYEGWQSPHTNNLKTLAWSFRNRKLIVKLCRAARMIHWLVDEFQPRGAITIIRHPCAVISSCASKPFERNWGFKGLNPDELFARVLAAGRLPAGALERAQSVSGLIQTFPDVLALMWSIDHYVQFLASPKLGHPWLLVPYEQLVLDGHAQLQRISDYLDEDLLQKAGGRLETPSRTVVDPVRKDVAQLSKWKESLSSDRVEHILKITAAFDLDFYSDNIEPDYQRLMSFSDY